MLKAIVIVKAVISSMRWISLVKDVMKIVPPALRQVGVTHALMDFLKEISAVYSVQKANM